MRPLFVFSADLHLEDGAWTSRPGIYGDAYCSFAQIIDYCIAHKLPLILGGDILEKKQNLARPITHLCAGLDRMAAANVAVYYIQGNHEFDRNSTWLSVHAWPVHLHKKTVEIHAAGDPRAVKIYGLDWLPRGDIQAALAEVPADTDILITHQVWEDFMGKLGRTDCSLADVHHVTTVLAGDFHVTKNVTAVNAQGRPVTMFSPGSTCMQDVSENPQKFIFEVNCSNGTSPFEIVTKPLVTRPFLSYVVKDQDELDNLCAGRLAADIKFVSSPEYPPLIATPIVRIKFDPQLPDAYLRLMTAAGTSAHMFCEALTEKAAKKAASRSTGRNDIIAALDDLLPPNSPAHKLAAALVEAHDPTTEIEAQLEKFLNADDEASSAQEVQTVQLTNDELQALVAQSSPPAELLDDPQPERPW